MFRRPLTVSFDSSDTSSIQNSTMTTREMSVSTVDPNLENRQALFPYFAFSAGLLGNILALILMTVSPAERKRKNFYKLMAALVFTNLLGTSYISPVVIYTNVTGLKLDNEMPLCHYQSFMFIFSGFATMSLVCAIAVERYICVHHPYTYYCKLSTSYAKYAIAVSWLIPIAIAALPLIGFGQNFAHFPKTWCFINIRSTVPKDVAFSFIYAAIVLIAVILTLGCNLCTIVGVLALKRRQRALSEPRGSDARKARSLDQRINEIQMIIMLVGVTITFCSCFGPLMVFIILCQTSLVERINVDYWYVNLIRLAIFNPILDPWVYLLVRREIRWKIICVFKFVLGIRKKAPSPRAVQDEANKGPTSPSHDADMSCLKFCFHCMCDPPVQKTRPPRPGRSSPPAEQSAAPTDGALRCSVSQPSPSEHKMTTGAEISDLSDSASSTAC